MCTVSWRADADGYEVLFNRDELRSRPHALPPVKRIADSDLGFLAPTDPEGGGTWILVNQAGLALCLVNGYRRADLATGIDWRSRGLLVTDLAGCTDPQQIAQALGYQVRTHRYRAFSLLAFSPESEPQGWRWSGAVDDELEPFAPNAPVTSSSLDADGASELRTRLFLALPQPPDGNDLLALHASHDGTSRLLTPCMHRPEARTVSMTRVRVGNDGVSMEYTPGPPCRHSLGEPLSIPWSAEILLAE